MDTTPENERLIDSFSTHWIKYATPAIIYAVMMCMAMLTFVLSQLAVSASPWLANVSFIIGLVLMLGVHHWFFHKIFSEHLMTIIITTRRFIFLRDCLFFRDDMHEISLERILAVRAKKYGLIQNILDYGSLWFDTGGTTTENSPIIPQVPHPHFRVKVIMKLMRMEGV